MTKLLRPLAVKLLEFHCEPVAPRISFDPCLNVRASEKEAGLKSERLSLQDEKKKTNLGATQLVSILNGGSWDGKQQFTCPPSEMTRCSQQHCGNAGSPKAVAVWLLAGWARPANVSREREEWPMGASLQISNFSNDQH